MLAMPVDFEHETTQATPIRTGRSFTEWLDDLAAGECTKEAVIRGVRESMLPGIKERIEKAMSVTILRETDGIEKNLGLLATIGSVSPFIGLFGTVWGIMNSFSAIAARHDTTLAVVAPGIAEALFATAMGLLAAIPAVIFYNRFVAEIGRYVNSLDAFADEFSAILSRQLDEKAQR